MATAASLNTDRMTDTERVASELLLSAIAFERFGTDMTARIMRRFQDMERDLAATVVDLDYLSARTAEERNVLLAELMDVAGDIVTATYEAILAEMTQDLDAVAETSEGSAINALALVLGAAFAIPKLRTVPVERLRELADETRIEGGLVSEWLERQKDDAIFRFKRAVMDTESNDLDIGDLVESVTGTRSAGRQDGIFQSAKRNAESLARTAVAAVAAKVRLEVYERNSGDDGVIVAVGQISTLDSRTSDVCIAYSGCRWKYPDYEPIGHRLPFNGGTPRHFRCRSVIVPIINAKEKAQGEQASQYGPVPAHWTYEDWLRSRPEDERKDILGAAKFTLWKSGKISFADLVDQRGNPLTVAELIKRFSRRQPD